MNKNSVLELAQMIANKTTFLQVARTATRGNVVQKNMVLEGKQAVKFFDKAPDFLQGLVESINPKKLSVRYGVKGYKGSSVTGFHIFDGDTVVAKGALGLDKKIGKEPYIQFNMKLAPKGGEASLSFKYNGNSVFTPNMSASQNLKGGKLRHELQYGDTMRIEYVETEGFSDYMRACGIDYKFDMVEIPSTKEMLQGQESFNKKMLEVTGGRVIYTEEELAARELTIESLKKHRPKKDLSVKVRKEYREMPADEVDAKLKLIEKIDANSAVDRAYLQELVAKEEILPYFNSSTVQKIKNLKCPKEEYADRLTKIFMEEMGYKPGVIRVEQKAIEGRHDCMAAGFDFKGGFIQVDPSFTESKEVMACMIRHELDHFDLHARLAKTIGLENFYEILSKGDSYKKALINKKFWEAAMVDAKPLSKSEVSRYIKDVKKYYCPDNSDGIEKWIIYHSNGIEIRAHDVQTSLAKSLGIDTKNLVYNSFVTNRIYTRISKELDRIIGKSGTQSEKDELVLTLLFDEYMKADVKNFNILKIYNNVLDRLRCM